MHTIGWNNKHLLRIHRQYVRIFPMAILKVGAMHFALTVYNKIVFIALGVYMSSNGMIWR